MHHVARPDFIHQPGLKVVSQHRVVNPLGGHALKGVLVHRPVGGVGHGHAERVFRQHFGGGDAAVPVYERLHKTHVALDVILFRLGCEPFQGKVLEYLGGTLEVHAGEDVKGLFVPFPHPLFYGVPDHVADGFAGPRIHVHRGVVGVGQHIHARFILRLRAVNVIAADTKTLVGRVVMRHEDGVVALFFQGFHQPFRVFQKDELIALPVKHVRQIAAADFARADQHQFPFCHFSSS